MYDDVFRPPSYDFSHQTLNDTGELEYVHSDGALRVAAKLLMMEQRDDLMPHRREANQRELGHLVFEMAYRSGKLDEYIIMNHQAVDLSAA